MDVGKREDQMLEHIYDMMLNRSALEAQIAQLEADLHTAVEAALAR